MEYTRLLEEDLRKTEAPTARRKAEKEGFARLVGEDMRRTREAHPSRRATGQEEKQRQAKRESMENKFPS